MQGTGLVSLSSCQLSRVLRFYPSQIFHGNFTRPHSYPWIAIMNYYYAHGVCELDTSSLLSCLVTLSHISLYFLWLSQDLKLFEIILYINLFTSLLSVCPSLEFKGHKSKGFARLVDYGIFSAKNSVWHKIGLQ